MLYVKRWVALHLVKGKIVCKNVNWISLVQVNATLDENQDQTNRRNRRKNGLARQKINQQNAQINSGLIYY